jgi:FkbM family methyltransferase
MFLNKFSRKCFSQQGEDLVIEFIFGELGIESPYYIDIGSNHPFKLSNTFLFYQNGGNGICIDPNPFFKSLYKRHRKKDVFLNVGLSSSGEKSALFYEMDWHEFSTFSKEQAETVEKNYAGRNNITNVSELPLISLDDLYLKVAKPVDLLSLDVEGMDLEILSSWNFTKCKPKVICVEHKQFVQEDSAGISVQSILELNGYKLRSWNSINAIYVI